MRLVLSVRDRCSPFARCTGIRAGRAGTQLLLSSDTTTAQGDVEGAAWSDNLLTSYQRLLARGSLLPDATQASAVRALQLLQDAVLQREATRVVAVSPGTALGHCTGVKGADTGPTRTGAGAFGSGSSGVTGSESGDFRADGPRGNGGTRDATPPNPPRLPVRGAYLWGPVGSGKTALMDLFAATTRQRLTLPTSAPPPAVDTPLQVPPGSPPAPAGPAPAWPRSAWRQHFHEFMQSVHGRLHELQLAQPKVVARSRQGMLVYRYAEPEEDPLETVAREWSGSTAVLCLDELHVTDVPDAMILSRLFGSLLGDLNTAVVFTSNTPPVDLYKGGLSRRYFEPFVRLLDEQMVVLRVAGGVDYRRAGGRAAAVESVAVAAAATTGAGMQDFADGRWFVGPAAAELLRRHWQQRTADTASAVHGSSNSSSSSETLGGDGGAAAPAVGPVEVPLAYGRTLKVPCAIGDAVRGPFFVLVWHRPASSCRADWRTWRLIGSTRQLLHAVPLNAAFRSPPAWFSFEQLCGATGLRAAVDDGGALAAPDFLALCRRFRELYISGVPELGPAQRDEARRLVTLLDVAYDNRCRLAVAAATPPDRLFAALLKLARLEGVNPRLGLPKSTQRLKAAAGDSSGGSDAAAAVVAAASPIVPAASITAALHMRLGPSMTHGLAATNTITVPPGEITGAIQAPFASVPPQSSTPPPPSPSPPPPPPVTAGYIAPQQLQPHLPPRQEAGSQPHRAPAAGAAAVRGDLAVPRALLVQEVLMYHRAASRLAEMCRVVEAVGPVS